MTGSECPRREFLKVLASLSPAAVFDWDVFPRAGRQAAGAGSYDVVIIGAGLGGLSCGAAFARQGFKPLVIEQHDKPGGYATAFRRPGGFLFDVSLHSTGIGERNGVRNLIGGFPEITSIEFLQHPTLFRAVFPGHDVRVPQRDPQAFLKTLIGLFPEERDGITGLFDDMAGLGNEINRLGASGGKVDMSRFATDFPLLARCAGKTWGAMADARIRDAKLKAIVSAQWWYYGLPPSKLSSFYYAIPFMGYLTVGGYYPRGRSQDISTALAAIVQQRGGTVLLNTRVEKIRVEGGRATGVVTAGGPEYAARAVVSNANPFDTLGKMVGEQAPVSEYQAKWQQYSVSLSSFQVFLGLKEDLVGKLGLTDSEIFVETGYDPDAAYERARAGNVEDGAYLAALYDCIDRGYSPRRKNTINLLTLQGYGPWERFEKDYDAGNKAEYRKEKERMAAALIRRAEQSLLPGLSKAIEVKEIGTPLTNRRYTGHYRGAVYGWDQTPNNSGNTRVGHATPIKDLYMAGAWSRPGHGYGSVIGSGLECFAQIVKGW